MPYSKEKKQTFLPSSEIPSTWSRQPDASFLLHLVQSTNDAIISTDLRGNILSWNPAAEKMYGYSSEEVIGRPVSIIIPPGYIKDLLRIFDKVRKGETIPHFESLREQKDGLRIDVSSTVSPVRDESGQVVGVSEIAHEITQQKIKEEEGKKSQKHLILEKEKLIETLSINQKMISILDLDDLVEFVIEKVTEILAAHRCSLMFFDQDSKELSIKGAKGLSRHVIRNTRVKAGEGVSGLVAQRGKPLLVADVESERYLTKENRRSYKGRSFLSMPVQLKGRIVGVVNVTDKDAGHGGVFTETDLKILSAITRQAEIAFENTHLYKELRHQSITDPLTGLFNHRFFVRCLKQEMKRANRYHMELSLMMIDIDGFKKYNDTFGHVAGDNLIKDIAGILKNNLRKVDVLCRYGGDEFSAILPGTSIPQVRIVAGKLKRMVQEFSAQSGVTLSVGISSYVKNMDRYDFVMKADQALYEAKRTGKNKVCSG